MKPDRVLTRTTTFEGHGQRTEDGVEYWLARDLQHLLGYTEWRNFLKIATKTKTSCEVSGHRVADQFVDVNKMVEISSGAQRQIEDIMRAEKKKPRLLSTASGRGRTSEVYA